VPDGTVTFREDFMALVSGTEVSWVSVVPPTAM
jgi:hypothetical protein